MRLLVVDDEVRFANALASGFRAEGFAVDLVHDGRSGLDAALSDRYDLLIVDVMLPVLSGYLLVRGLRAAGVWTPVLMLTAKDGEYDEADALDEGADDYLTKPFSFVVLLARVRALIRRGRTTRPVVLTVGDLTLDPASRRVTRSGATIPLTVREFALLEYLLRRPGEMVSKTELYEHVWEGNDEAKDFNVVEVYVGYLRRKLGREVVHTVRGAGYRVTGAL